MRKIGFTILLVIGLLLAGCTAEKDEMQKELDSVLNDVQIHESELSDYESQLRELEKKEQKLFEKTVDLKIEERDIIDANVSRLDELLASREDIIEQEMDVVKKAQEIITRLTTLPPADTEKGDRSVRDLKVALDKRYELNEEVLSLYEELMERQRKVYELLIDENVKRVDLEEGTLAVNKQRSSLEEVVQAFNQSTNEVNSALISTQQDMTE